jgi:hypothetical protein
MWKLLGRMLGGIANAVCALFTAGVRDRIVAGVCIAVVLACFGIIKPF